MSSLGILAREKFIVDLRPLGVTSGDDEEISSTVVLEYVNGRIHTCQSFSGGTSLFIPFLRRMYLNANASGLV